MKHSILFLAVAVFLQACSSKANELKEVPKTESIAVKLIPIKEQAGVATIEASGLLATENEAHLSFKIGGIIENVFVKEGQTVKKGQLLATLKANEISAEVEQVRLSIDKAQRDYQRAVNLYKDSVATLEQLQNAKTGLDIAKQGYQQAAFNQQYSKIYAPADGFVVKKMYNTGELAKSGEPVIIMNIINGGSKWILKVGVPDKEWAIIENGNKADVKFDAYPGKTFSAIVSKRSLAADAVTGSFQIELQIDPQHLHPATGMFGKATIFPDRPQTGSSIPYEALLEANGKEGFVFVSDNKKTVKRIPVTISDIKENVVNVSHGLEGHSFIVTAGSPYLSDNSAITVQQ
ncbi:MAG: efflux RND transporter periplasmic adaptor subunit [Ginsengibacter sp.]